MAAPETQPPAAELSANRRGDAENLGGTLSKITKKKKPFAQSKSWRDVIGVHPAAEILPQNESDVAALAADIKKYGLRHPVVMVRRHGQHCLLDGRNRMDAMEQAGIEIFDEDGQLKREFWCGPGEGYKGDPYAYATSTNIHRRHLDADQKRKALEDLIKAEPSKSNRAIADTIDYDHKTVAAARAKLESTGEVSPVARTIGLDGKLRPAKKPRKPTPASNVVMLGAPDIPAFLTKDPEARAKAEEDEYEKVVVAYSILTPKMKQIFLDYVIAGQTASVIDAALARLEDHARRELAERILRTPPDLGGAA